MTGQLFDLELIRMTFVVGIAVSVLVYERTHTTTASLVVPGYIGVNLLNPPALLATAINAGVTFLLVSRVLPRIAAIYGRARFVTNIAVSVILALLIGPTLASTTGPSFPTLDAIGYVIPALIAYDMNRQGAAKTATAVGVSGCLAALPGLLLVSAFPGMVEPNLPLDTGLFPVGDVWFPIVALVSTGVSASLYDNHGLRAGGFVGPMYLGLAAVRPLQVIYLLGAAALIHTVVDRGVKPMMITFGRRKFAVMLMGGSMMSWAMLSLAGWLRLDGLLLGNLPIAGLFVPALLANDMERTSVRDVFVGGYLAGGATLSVVVVASAAVDGETTPWWAPPAVFVSIIILFWPRLVKQGQRFAHRYRGRSFPRATPSAPRH